MISPRFFRNDSHTARSYLGRGGYLNSPCFRLSLPSPCLFGTIVRKQRPRPLSHTQEERLSFCLCRHWPLSRLYDVGVAVSVVVNDHCPYVLSSVALMAEAMTTHHWIIICSGSGDLYLDLDHNSSDTDKINWYIFYHDSETQSKQLVIRRHCILIIYIYDQ